jgi:hypothetical protein
MALPVLAQEAVRIAARSNGSKVRSVVKNRDGSEVKLTPTDNPLFIVIVRRK